MKTLDFIRKFGLEHCDLPTMLWNVSFLLRHLSLDIDNKGIPAIFYILTIISASCYFYVYVISMFWFVFWRCAQTGDVLPAMLVFSLGVAGEIGPVKLIYAMLHRKKVRNLVRTSLACDAHVIPGSRFSKKLQKSLKNVKGRAIVFWIIMMVNGLIYLARPFLKPGRHLTEDIFMYYGIPVIFYLLTIVSATCYIYIYLVSAAWFVFWRCVETGDVLAATLVFSLTVAGEIGPVKLVYTMFYRKSVRNIAAASLACDAQVVPGDRFSKTLQKTLKSVKRRAMVFWIIMMGNGLVYLVKPFFMPGRHLMDDVFVYYGLDPMYETPNYEISMIATIFGVLFACYSAVNVTAFVIINVGYVEAQMLAWSEELRHLWDDFELFHQENRVAINIYGRVGRSDYKTDANKFIQSRLRDIIRGHARNLDLLQQIEGVFRGAFVLEFLILIVGLISELHGGLEKTYIEVPFSFLAVVVDCLTGQRLADASIAFEKAVFDCKWENFNSSNMKLVLLMLQNSQKTMTLSAGGVTVLNFSLLMSVIRSVYSAYTTLRSSTS